MASEARVVGRSLAREALSYGLSPIPCFRCGVCCSACLPQLDQGEIEEIARGLRVSVEMVLREYARPHPSRPGYYLLRRRGEGCAFLQREGDFTLCRIYPFKPEACRSYQPSLEKGECWEGLKRVSLASTPSWAALPSGPGGGPFLNGDKRKRRNAALNKRKRVATLKHRRREKKLTAKQKPQRAAGGG